MSDEEANVMMTIRLRMALIANWWAPFLLRLSIALDDFIQAWFRFGTIGVTISSRIGIAAAHGHLWGIIGWQLLDVCWPFRKDPVTGQSHCAGAWDSDTARALAAIIKIKGDPVVVSFKWQGFSAEFAKWLAARKLPHQATR